MSGKYYSEMDCISTFKSIVQVLDEMFQLQTVDGPGYRTDCVVVQGNLRIANWEFIKMNSSIITLHVQFPKTTHISFTVENGVKCTVEWAEIGHRCMPNCILSLVHYNNNVL